MASPEDKFSAAYERTRNSEKDRVSLSPAYH